MCKMPEFDMSAVKKQMIKDESDFCDVLAVFARLPNAVAWRSGWHGKKQFIYKERGKSLEFAVLRGPLKTFVKTVFGEENLRIFPHFNFLSEEGLVSGWLASQTDMTADDWCIARIQE